MTAMFGVIDKSIFNTRLSLNQTLSERIILFVIETQFIIMSEKRNVIFLLKREKNYYQLL